MLGSAEWNEFLIQVQLTRIELKCSVSSAWFRGHSDASWKLQPSLLREYVIGEVGISGDVIAPYLSDEEFKTAFEFIESKKSYRLRLSADQAKRIAQVLQSVKYGREKLKRYAKQSQELQGVLRGSERAQKGSTKPSELKSEALTDICQKNKIPLVPAGNSPRDVESALRNLDIKLIRTLVEKARAAQKKRGGRAGQTTRSPSLKTVSCLW